MTATDLPRTRVPPMVRTGPLPDPDAPGRIPFAIGVALFLALFGSLMQVPYMWQAQILLVPATVGLFVIVGIRTKPLREVKIDPWLFPILVWVLMSIGWTTGDLKAGIQEAALALALVLSVHVAGSVFDARGVLSFLAGASVVLAVVVLIDAAVRPGRAFSAGQGELESLGLRSFFYQKNSLAGALVLGFSVRAAIRRHWLRVSYTALVIVLLVLCRSSTAMIAAVSIAVLQALSARIIVERRRGQSGSTFIIAGLALILGAIVIGLRAQIFGLFGKDSSLTGRTLIWDYVWRAIGAHRWAGYGPAGFWETGNNGLADLQHAAQWDVGNAHQGLLDQWLEYGAIGVALVLFAYIAAVLRIGRRILAGDISPAVPACLGLWTATVITSVTEDVLLTPGLATVGLIAALMLNTPMSVLPRWQAAGNLRPTHPAVRATGRSINRPTAPRRTTTVSRGSRDATT